LLNFNGGSMGDSPPENRGICSTRGPIRSRDEPEPSAMAALHTQSHPAAYPAREQC